MLAMSCPLIPPLCYDAGRWPSPHANQTTVPCSWTSWLHKSKPNKLLFQKMHDLISNIWKQAKVLYRENTIQNGEARVLELHWAPRICANRLNHRFYWDNYLDSYLYKSTLKFVLISLTLLTAEVWMTLKKSWGSLGGNPKVSMSGKHFFFP